MAFNRDESAGYLTNYLARLFARRLSERISPLGLRPAQFVALLELWAEDGLTQKQLVERLTIEQATMANTLARMERDGLIRRRADPADRRTQLVYLTEKARVLEGPATEAAAAVNRRALSALGPDERRQMIAFLRRMIAALDGSGAD